MLFGSSPGLYSIDAQSHDLSRLTLLERSAREERRRKSPGSERRSYCVMSRPGACQYLRYSSTSPVHAGRNDVRKKQLVTYDDTPSRSTEKMRERWR